MGVLRLGKLLGEGSILSYLTTGKGSCILAIVFIVLSSVAIIGSIVNINSYMIIQKVLRFLLKISSKFIKGREEKYHRDLEIGKIHEKKQRVKTYRFLNDLIIDLKLKQMGATPYEFLFIVVVGSAVLTLVLCQILFGNMWMAVVMTPIIFAGIMSVLYTKANIAHDTRIENVIEAENIISNNIKEGFVVAVRDSIGAIPEQIRGVFEDFLDNVELKNYHIRTALLELNQQLGTVSDDFIKKCIIFETEEEHGIADMFQDIVEINNIKMELRTDVKRQFEEVVAEFIIGATMIFLFLGGVLAIYTNVANFYFRTPLGQIIIAIDVLILIGEFVYITYLRAKEI